MKAQIEHIRTLYGAALALPAQKMVFDCEDDHASGTFLTRHKDTQLLWARYAMGYEHGGMSFEMLFEGNQVLFVLKENNSWSFDQASDLPDDGGGTVDTISQARYYYREGTLIRALHKEASARSILNEELQVGLEKAENKPHKTADGPKILETAQRLHKAHLQHEITEQWCGI
ncbi:MAG TPA: hypothetical protein DFR83_24145 [Deltaproteobacteria bacterium]|nr:hypothetical protein [Deltaproteobacteria bacterium]